MIPQLTEGLQQASTHKRNEVNKSQYELQAMIKSLQQTYENFTQATRQSLIALSSKHDTVCTVELNELKSDLVDRQFVMKIFEYLTEKPIKYQMLSQRFYRGIVPNWIGSVFQSKLSIRLSEGIESEPGPIRARNEDYEEFVLDFPS
jgi:hypothetical protein